MNKETCYKIVKDTLQNGFDKERFIFFIKNLLNEINESKAFHAHGYVRHQFKQVAGIVKTYERIGTYVDPEEKKIDLLIVYLEKEKSIDRARTSLRNFGADYLKQRGQKDAALVAFVSPNFNDWRFSLIKMDYKFEEGKSGKIKVKEEFTPARRWSFLVGAKESSHTAQSRLAPILEDDERKPMLEQLEDAFNIEKVTKEFFGKYRELFLNLKDNLDKMVTKDSKIKKDFLEKDINTIDFAKKLLGQIVFLYFLQKKGWFGVERDADWSTGHKDFLRRLFEKKHGGYKNFFNDIIEPLFYEALRLERPGDYYSRFDCRIPFLNGGLFDPLNDYDWWNTDILLPNELFSNNVKTKEGDIGDGILDVFDRYNFTVKEDEPLEKEIAIDPEMLGKVFENLLEVKDRKSKGTYYTPREIVHYMCQESLINYLATETNIDRKKLNLLMHFDTFMAQKMPKEKRMKAIAMWEGEVKDIEKSLDTILIVDPACGSGAFLVGMMQEIIKLRKILILFFKTNDLNDYQQKLSNIQKNIYGVDIDPSAVEIAKLRLWLSLIVDEEDIKNIKPLPNLDYKIICGNSLLGIDRQDMFIDFKLKQIEKLKPLLFQETNSKKKQEYKRQIDKLIGEITNNLQVFDFEIYFSEVFHEKKGFDVVIANPPYIRADSPEIKEQRELIMKSREYQTLYEKWDLYVAFIEKGYGLLAQNGVIEFIIPDAYMSSKYAEKSHEYFLHNATINRIDFCSDLKIFEAAVRNIIIEFTKHTNPDHIPLRIKHKGNWDNFIILPSKKQLEMGKNTFRLDSENKIIGDLSNTLTWGEICYVSVGLVLQSEEKLYKGEFIKEDLISNQKDKIHTKPYIEAKWIKRYFIENIKYLEWNTDRIPKKIRRPTFPELYVSEKIMLGGMTGAIFDERGLLCNHSITVSVLWKDLADVNNRSIEVSIKKDFHIKSVQASRKQLEENSGLFNLKYLLAILNSKFAHKFLDSVRRSQIGFYPDDLKKLPIKKVSTTVQKPFIEIIDKILAITKSSDYLEDSANQVKVHEYKNKIDQMVYKLYDLTPEEKNIVEKINEK